jgi:hypothetical protein
MQVWGKIGHLPTMKWPSTSNPMILDDLLRSTVC